MPLLITNDLKFDIAFRFHILAFSTAIGCLLTGATYALPLVKNYPPTPKQLLANVQSKQINKLVSVPILLEQLISEIDSDESATYALLSHIEFICYGGAAMSDKICLKLIDNGIHLVSCYGTTETVNRNDYFD
jgi:acyl-coenzyme A synthetase/AMP-(fatty) acid ligase